MSTYITLNKVHIQNANCVSGLTYGFPAVTHFLGYVHALSRKLQQCNDIKLTGCAIVCHHHQIHAYQPKGFGTYIFAQTRNPLTKEGKSAPIIEEGKMHLTVSLVIKSEGLISGGEAGIKKFEKQMKQLCLTQKLAGGVINYIQSVVIESASTNQEQRTLTRKICRRLLPSFILRDRSLYLEKHFLALQKHDPDVEILDAWLDFSALKSQAELLEETETPTEKTKAKWHYVPKPEAGYLVPIVTGYKAISDVYDAGIIPNTRDPNVPFCFVEAAYGLGEWQSPHRLKNIEDALWHYQDKEGWYLCSSQTTIDADTVEHEEDNFDFLSL